MESRSLYIPEGLAGERVDAGLARLLGVSRVLVANAAVAGQVLQDGVVMAKSDRLVAGAWLEINWESAKIAEVVAQDIPDLKILYLDDDIVVVDKPVGVAAHPAPSWSGPTVLGGLAALNISTANHGVPERQGIVHRLDVGTSGVMMVARTNEAYSILKQAFRDRTIKKSYHALVQGLMDPLIGTIDAPIGRHPKSDWKFAVVAEGRHAITHYETLEAFKYASLLEIELETGRTHQIRVHFSAERHPCVGDPLYGSDPVLSAKLKLDRQWLHAVKLGFEHPTSKEWLEVSSEYPSDLATALEIVRQL